MRSFAFRFLIGCFIGLFITGVVALATGKFFYWMAPIVGMFYGTLRAMHDEDDTR